MEPLQTRVKKNKRGLGAEKLKKKEQRKDPSSKVRMFVALNISFFWPLYAYACTAISGSIIILLVLQTSKMEIREM